MTSSAQYPGRFSALITANPLKGYPHSLWSGLIRNFNLIMKGASTNEQKHLAAMREGVE